MNKPSCIYEFLKNGLIFESTDLACRTKQELHALRLLESRSNYLSVYNRSIRYMFLILFKHGYDLHSSKVHKTFSAFCIAYLGMDDILVSKLIKERHAYKYAKQEVNLEYYQQLCTMAEKLKTKYTLLNS